MWVYQKMLQYPARVRTTNPRLAKAVITQYGGPDGELAASLRYLTQRYTMPIPEAKAALTDIGTEELAHMEIVATLVYNLIKDASIAEIKRAGLDGYYADHDKALYFVNAEGMPWIASYIQSKGDPITDIHENMAAEQKARSTYEYLIQLSDDPDVTDTLRFLWQREIVHFQRFGEILNLLHDYYGRERVFHMKGWDPKNLPTVDK
ncbi:MAG: manganese catalase family protein [Bacillota bacterium]|jgi:spore coat protein JC|nr:manganese catalase family protein [Candidatus Fermentithermobacillaceae bacterium]HAF67157.1 rubrerythrin family protein [Clostridiales bacterium UBA9857]HOA70579.1 manganese catalase family protein [Bacillota bacterium]HOP70549.1 manganese catalase family protein [Bacillota bacterium]HPT34934.1 manganese catalase family protein [Bacillota bacterium]